MKRGKTLRFKLYLRVRGWYIVLVNSRESQDDMAYIFQALKLLSQLLIFSSEPLVWKTYVNLEKFLVRNNLN